MTYGEKVKWLALDIILFAVHDWLGDNERLRRSAIVFFSGDERESLYHFWLSVLDINIDKGVPSPEEIVTMLGDAGYSKPLDARASKLYQLPTHTAFKE